MKGRPLLDEEGMVLFIIELRIHLGEHGEMTVRFTSTK